MTNTSEKAGALMAIGLKFGRTRAKDVQAKEKTYAAAIMEQLHQNKNQDGS